MKWDGGITAVDSTPFLGGMGDVIRMYPPIYHTNVMVVSFELGTKG